MFEIQLKQKLNEGFDNIELITSSDNLENVLIGLETKVNVDTSVLNDVNVFIAEDVI